MRTLVLLLAAACSSPDPDHVDTGPDPYVPPAGATTADHDPEASLTTFPDLVHTVQDAATVTGVRVRLRPGAADSLNALLPEGFNLVEALEELDGFGTTAGVVLAFTAPMDPAGFERSLKMVRVPQGEPVATSTWWSEDGTMAVVEPLRPLQPATTYAVAVDRDLVDAQGGAVWPSVALHRAVHGDTDARLASAWADALAALAMEADDVAHGTVFVTQSLHTQDEAVASLVRAEGPVITRGTCEDAGATRRCSATLTLADVLGPDGTLGADEVPTVQGTYELPVTVSLPPAGTPGPYPFLVHGHGLGGDRGESHGVAATVAPEGVAVVAVDAPRHGDHPLASDGDLLWILEFFGIDLLQRSMDVRVLRDDFRLAAWERVQLLEALADGLDVDGDDVNDLDADAIGYSGHSLGGVMGPQLVALAPEVGTAYLSVPGGRVSAIVQRGQIFGPLVALMAPPGARAADIDRFFPALQTAIERGDPLVWAPRLLDGTRDVIVQQVMDDTIMPNETTDALARALGLQRIGPALRDVAGLGDGPAPPVAGNVGGRTGALYQLDTMQTREGLVPATHTHVFSSDTNKVQLRHWLRTWLEDGTAELIDPLANMP